jgi:hypothetical protein
MQAQTLTLLLLKIELHYAITKQVLDQRWSPHLKDCGSDNALLSTAQDVVIDEYGAMVKWWLAGEI